MTDSLAQLQAALDTMSAPPPLSWRSVRNALALALPFWAGVAWLVAR